MKPEIEAIKRKKQQADKAEQRRRYNIACEIAIVRKQKLEAARKGKKHFKTKHLLASFSIGLAFGIAVMFFLPSQLKSKKIINDKNIVVSKNKVVKESSTQLPVDPITLQQQTSIAIKEIQNKVRKVAKKRKTIRKNKKKQIVIQEKKQPSKKQTKKYSLPPDLRAEMMGR